MSSQQKTIIGAGTRISGNLQGDEDLTVFGRLDGQVTLSGSSLSVESAGMVVADVHATSVVINGTVVGNINASDMIHISEQGRVVGDIATPRLIIEEGASFRGAIDMGEVEESFAEVATRKPAAAAAARAPRTTRPQSAAPAVDAEPEPQPEPEPPQEAPTTRRPVPRPAPPPRRVARAASSDESSSMQSRASAAAKAVAKAVKAEATGRTRAKAASKKAPKPPTTAGKKSRAKRK
jgi:cytoskeletal protein CcmA (bactofilin family)